MNNTNQSKFVVGKWRAQEFANRSTATIAVETSILLLIGLIAIGGNLLVIISIYRNPSLRTITNYFVFSLSVTDILYPVLALPLSVYWSLKSAYSQHENIWCEMQAITSISLIHVSIMTIILMAVNRFVRVCKSHRYKHWFNRKTSLVMVFSMWVVVFVFMTLSVKTKAFVFAKFEYQKIICGFTRSKDEFSKALSNLVLILEIALPFAIIMFCYFRVFKKIREHRRNRITPTNNSSPLGPSIQDIKVTWTLFAILAGYCITWFPVLIIVLIANYNRRLPREAHMIVTYSMACSSAINPVIYGAMSPTFRQEYKKILRLSRT